LTSDIASSLPRFRVETVFDVGANVGQSTRRYLAAFPDAHIYCFEPVHDTFKQLEENLKGNDRVDCCQLAVASRKGRGEMCVQGCSLMFFLVGDSKRAPIDGNVPTEPVEVVTLDEFCQIRGIDHISFLKIDTEGGDLEVLKGAMSMLAEQKIDLVQVEAGMNPGNTWHVSLERLKGFLESRRYFLFGIYEQESEWPTEEPHLRYVNAAFISAELIGKNRAGATSVT